MPERDDTPVAGALRGVVGAMAMSGLRTVTTHLGLLPRTPPERMFDATVERMAPEVQGDARAVAQELAHWAYGAAGGAAFTLLPAELRRPRAAGPLYGLVVWALFEVAIAPLLGGAARWRRPVAERVALIADHALYGLVVGARLPQEQTGDTAPD